MVEVAPDTEDLAGSGLRLEIDGAVATITLIRPERRNAQTPGMWRALARIGDTLPVGVRVVVVRGEGPSFSSGIDLRALSAAGVPGEEPALDPEAGAEEVERTIAGYQRGFMWLRRPAIVSIAAVRGHAIGAGFQLALACDLRIAAADASFCMKEAALGLVPDLTGTKPLVDAVGLARAMEMCLTVRTVPAEEARELGIVQAVVPVAELDDAVRDLAAALLQVDGGAAAATKSLLQQAPGNSLDEQAAAERRHQIDRLRVLFAARG
ncbi:MAG TPA: enoyl-CoA hydratase/isomerase family protein [Streptosporangiaceae bacterium]|nr:enoyl-CoA hydratase/isomerase family protein [Streptosporangiaceae bacterium]